MRSTGLGAEALSHVILVVLACSGTIVRATPRML